MSFHQQGQLADAERAYCEALRAVDNIRFHATHLLGLVHAETGRLEEAFELVARAIAINANEAEAHFNLANILKDLGRLDEATASYAKAIAYKPDHVYAHSNLGNTLKILQRFDEALINYDAAIAVKPDFAEAHCNRGTALYELKRLDDAISSHEEAIDLRPDFVEAHLNRGLCHLLTGDFERGWPAYELRKYKMTPATHRPFEQPLWLGEEDLQGKTILVHDEQGFGDTIQFCRFIEPLNELGANVLFAPKQGLVALMLTLSGEFRLVDWDDPTITFDVHCPLLSLPLALKVELATIPDRVPYLRADPARIDRWAERIGRDKFRIGICWQGSTAQIDAGRSFPLAQFCRLAQLPDVRLISLHKGSGESQLADLPIGMAVETLGADFDSGADAFVDSAAAIKCCDLVITSDTVIAHLAGALGQPVWLALKYVPEWRWMLDRSDSPWYPTMRLFRQPHPGDWTAVFARIENEVNALRHANRA